MQASRSGPSSWLIATRLGNSFKQGSQLVLQASTTTTLPRWLAINSSSPAPSRIFSDTSEAEGACPGSLGAGGAGAGAPDLATGPVGAGEQPAAKSKLSRA